MTLGPRAVFTVCATALAGCAGNEPQPRIDSVEPAQAYTDRDIRLVLTGAGFVPAFRLDPVSGERVAIMEGFSGRVGNQPSWLPLTNFGWVSLTQISASLDVQDPDDLAVGPCDVEITDPRGHKAVLPAGFFALGRHSFAPDLAVTSPAGEPYAPGSTIHAIVSAVDKPPGLMTALNWTYTEPPSALGVQRPPVLGYCPPVLGADRIDCTFYVTISPDLAPEMTVNLEIVASDDAVPPNQTSATISINLSERPTVSSVIPQTGGTAGGTDVVIKGSKFIRGSRAYFGNSLLIPDGGTWVDEQTISGYAPAGSGSVAVDVRSRLGKATWDKQYEYQPPPKIGSILPRYGSQGQDTSVQVLGSNFTTSTIIYLGQALATAVRLVPVSPISDGEIDVVVPGSSGLAWAWVWAFDVDNGWTRAPNPFSWITP